MASALRFSAHLDQIARIGQIPWAMFAIYVDGDGCPVKEGVYRCAARYGLKTYLVTNRPIFYPKGNIEAVVVGMDFDAADDWIEAHVVKNDIVITGDILLAARVIKKEARVVDPRGRILDEDNIGDALATRELLSDLRSMGAIGLGPQGMAKKHHSNFLASLDTTINASRMSEKNAPKATK